MVVYCIDILQNRKGTFLAAKNVYEKRRNGGEEAGKGTEKSLKHLERKEKIRKFEIHDCFNPTSPLYFPNTFILIDKVSLKGKLIDSSERLIPPG